MGKNKMVTMHKWDFCVHVTKMDEAILPYWNERDAKEYFMTERRWHNKLTPKARTKVHMMYCGEHKEKTHA